MSRISFAVLLLLFFVCLGMASMTLAQEYVQGMGGVGGPIGDPWGAIPQPSGMRFMAAPVSVQTGSMSGGDGAMGYGYRHGAPCSTCGLGGGMCIHWSQVTWYGRWDESSGYLSGGGHGCRRSCGGACGGN